MKFIKDINGLYYNINYVSRLFRHKNTICAQIEDMDGGFNRVVLSVFKDEASAQADLRALIRNIG